MSADNGVYILETKTEWHENPAGYFSRFPDGKFRSVYRVAHTQGIDNLDWYLENQIYNVGAFLVKTWGESPKFLDENEAFSYAKKLHDKAGWSEYGICTIDCCKDFVFFGMG